MLDHSYLIEGAALAARTADSDRSSGVESDQEACTGHLMVHTDLALAAPVVYM